MYILYWIIGDDCSSQRKKEFNLSCISPRDCRCIRQHHFSASNLTLATSKAQM